MRRFTKRVALAIFAAGLALPATLSRADDKAPGASNSATGSAGATSKTELPDQQFAIGAANGGMAEVQLGKVAQEKGQSQAVKDFGKKMIEDHGKTDDKLKALASSKGITLSSDVTGEEKDHAEKLSQLSGAEFDKAYTAYMIKDHRKAIGTFRKEAKDGKDAELKAFANETLPMLREHLKDIREVATNSGDASLAKLASEKRKPAPQADAKAPEQGQK